MSRKKTPPTTVHPSEPMEPESSDRHASSSAQDGSMQPSTTNGTGRTPLPSSPIRKSTSNGTGRTPLPSGPTRQTASNSAGRMTSNDIGKTPLSSGTIRLTASKDTGTASLRWAPYPSISSANHVSHGITTVITRRRATERRLKYRCKRGSRLRISSTYTEPQGSMSYSKL